MFFKKEKQRIFSEGEIENLIKALNQVVIILDQKGTVLKCYGRAEDAAIFGWSEGYVGKNLESIALNKIIYNLLADGIQQLRLGDDEVFTHSFSLDLNDNPNWFFAQLVKRFDESGFRGFMLVIENVTKDKHKQKEQERQIQELEGIKKAMFNLLEDIEQERKTSVVLAKDLEKFKLAVEFSSDHIQILDIDQSVVYMNRAAEKITGYSRQDCLGKKVVNLWRGMDKLVYKNLWHRIHKEKKPFIGEIVNKRKNGEVYPAAVQIYPLLDKEEEIMFYVGIERDITKLKEVDKMKSEFVSLASHQLRTPLSGIKWLTEILLDGKMGELNPQQHEMLKEVKESNDRMIKLVNDLLDISHIETGEKFMITKAEADLIEIIQTVLKEQAILAEKKQVNFHLLHALPDKLLLNIDGEKIRQVVQNFVNNAIKYSSSGKEIAIDLTSEPGRIIFMIRNFGVFIQPEEEKKIFEKFYRTDSAKNMDPAGSGLGLYIARAIVEGHGGKIWFTSGEKDGTTFYFSLESH